MLNIIISASSKYKELVNIFLEQYTKHMALNDANLFIASDEDINVDYPIKCKYINKEETIPGRIREIVQNEGEGYYLCFLADALICKNVKGEDVISFIDTMMSNGIRYCNLMPKTNKKCLFENINKKQRYGVSFIAFLASSDFIMEEFAKGITDYDFEEKYLKIANEASNDRYPDMCILCKNLFNIEHGIVGGKWDRKTYKILMKDGVCISNQIEKQSMRDYLFQKAARIVNKCMPNSIRLFLKRRMEKRGEKFKTAL